MWEKEGKRLNTGTKKKKNSDVPVLIVIQVYLFSSIRSKGDDASLDG